MKRRYEFSSRADAQHVLSYLEKNYDVTTGPILEVGEVVASGKKVDHFEFSIQANEKVLEKISEDINKDI